MIHLPPSLQTKSRVGDKKDSGRLSTVIESQERTLILDALKETRGNQSQSAKLLGTTKRIMQYKIQKLGIDPMKFRQRKREIQEAVKP